MDHRKIPSLAEAARIIIELLGNSNITDEEMMKNYGILITIEPRMRQDDL